MKRFALLLAVIAVSIGCGDKGPTTYPVSGTATWEGQPIPTGHVSFYPTDASGVAPDAGKIVDGKFSFQAKPGPKKVEIRADRAVGPDDKFMGGTPREQYIAPRYNDETILKEEVPVGGRSDYKFDLTKDGKSK
jgi:hypothetical protein